MSTNPKDKIGNTKPSIGLIPPSALIEEAMAFKDGADKYGAYNWRTTSVSMSVYLNALLRHTLALLDGEDYTSDSRVRHEAAIRACCAVIIDARCSNTLIDDRPPKGSAAKLLEEKTVKQRNTTIDTKTNFNHLKICGIPNCTDCRAQERKYISSFGKIDDVNCVTIDEHLKNLKTKPNRYFKYPTEDNK